MLWEYDINPVTPLPHIITEGEDMLSKDHIVAPLIKGQRITYQGDSAEVIRTSPVLVIKTKKRIVCGAIKVDPYTLITD